MEREKIWELSSLGWFYWLHCSQDSVVENLLLQLSIWLVCRNRKLPKIRKAPYSAATWEKNSKPNIRAWKFRSFPVPFRAAKDSSRPHSLFRRTSYLFLDKKKHIFRRVVRMAHVRGWTPGSGLWKATWVCVEKKGVGSLLLRAYLWGRKTQKWFFLVL